MTSYTSQCRRAATPSIYTLLRHRRLRWLGRLRRIQDGRIPRDLLHGEFATGKRTQGRPQLRFKDVCKRDTKALDMNVDGREDLAEDVGGWELDLAQDCFHWRQELNHDLCRGKEKLQLASDELRVRRKNSEQAPLREKGDTKALDMDVEGWELDLAHDRSRWELNRDLRRGKEKLQLASDELRVRISWNSQQALPADTTYKCSPCGRDCHSRIGLHSHNRRCSSSS